MKILISLVASSLLVFVNQEIYTQQERVTIAAASDLRFALDSIVQCFRNNNPETSVDVTYGSSGKLFEQLSNQAPFNLFFSADIDYPNRLRQKGLTLSNVESYGFGRIVIWSKKIDPSREGVASLTNPLISKIALANPLHAPYGKRAEESLQFYKLYDTIKDELVFGENISQTAQFITSGAADIGIIALSLALSPNMIKEKGNYFLLSENSHKPLEQGFVLMKNANQNKGAKNFHTFMSGSQAKTILEYFGFKPAQ